MRIKLPVSLFLLSILFYTSCKKSQTTGFVYDKAGVFTASQSKFLDSVIRNYESITSNEIFVYTVETISGTGKNPDQYAADLVKTLGVGKPGINNGILFFVSLKDKQVALRLGHGFEWLMGGDDRKNIVDQMTHAFSKSDFFAGMYTAVSKTMGLAANTTWQYCKDSSMDNCVRQAVVKNMISKANNILTITTKDNKTVSIKYTDYMLDLIDQVEKNKDIEIVYRSEAGDPGKGYLLGVL